ncbi:MAG: response regulator [Myxococcaceae bacterium]
MAPTGKRILYVEDSRSMRSLVSTWLASAGYQVTLGEDGDDGLTKARAQKPDLVLSDVNMPKRDGFELCRALKEAPETANVPVVLLTRMEAAHDILSGLDAGADAFILKGTPQEDLLMSLSRLLSDPTRTNTLVKDFSQRLLLTREREDILRLLFNALLKETQFDILVLLVNGPAGKHKPVIVTSRTPLSLKLLSWLAEQMVETFSLIGNTQLTLDGVQVQSIVAVEGDPLREAPAGLPQKYVKVPLQDNGDLTGVLGVFSYSSSDRLDEKIRLFFDLGVEFSRALQRLSVGGP